MLSPAVYTSDDLALNHLSPLARAFTGNRGPVANTAFPAIIPESTLVLPTTGAVVANKIATRQRIEK